MLQFIAHKQKDLRKSPKNMWRGFYINKDAEMIDCFESIPQDSLHIR